MKISETNIHDLLELTRTYATVPYNAIFMFIVYEEHHNLEFFNEHIARRLTYTNGYPNSVTRLVKDIQHEFLLHTQS